MKSLIGSCLLLSVLSFAVNTNAQEPISAADPKCGSRYIKAAADLIDISIAYNEGDMTPFDYYKSVKAVDVNLVKKRVACIYEDSDAKKCVDKTKGNYKSLRSKMKATGVMMGFVKKVDVDEIDLLVFLTGVLRKACLKSL